MAAPVLRRIGLRLYGGFLSFALAEVFAGSSPLWMLTPLTWLVSIPLYLVHFLFFASLAERTGRTSLPALYLWGVLFGLYESWITKVVWAGYGDSGFGFGGIFGFGFHELSGLVLFYHPVTSFILPLAVLGRLDRGVDAVFGEARALLAPGARAGTARVALAVVYAAISGFNLPTPAISLATFGSALFVLWLGFRLLRGGAPGREGSSALSLRGGGLAAVSVVMLLAYYAGYHLFRPALAPAWPVLLATLVLYALVALAIARTRRRAPAAGGAPRSGRDLLAWAGAIAVASLLVGLLPGHGWLLFMPVAFATIPAGAALLAWALVKMR